MIDSPQVTADKTDLSGISMHAITFSNCIFLRHCSNIKIPITDYIRSEEVQSKV